jgi:hypothetical protein
MIEAICGSVILIGLGLLSIFARDLMWELTHWSNSIKGLASERSENWDTWTVISGIILVIIGAGLGLAVISSGTQEQHENEEATATVNSRLTSLEATYAPIIPTLRANAEFEPQEVRGREFGLPSSQKLAYGLCSDEDFYLYIQNGSSFQGQAYVQDMQPGSCAPDGWNIYDSDLLGTSASDGSWYSINVIQMPTYDISSILTPDPTSTPRITPTPAPTRKGQQGP